MYPKGNGKKTSLMDHFFEWWKKVGAKLHCMLLIFRSLKSKYISEKVYLKQYIWNSISEKVYLKQYIWNGSCITRWWKFFVNCSIKEQSSVTQLKRGNISRLLPMSWMIIHRKINMHLSTLFNTEYGIKCFSIFTFHQKMREVAMKWWTLRNGRHFWWWSSSNFISFNSRINLRCN